MKIKLVVESDTGAVESVTEIARLERGTVPGEIGLTLAEAKRILGRIQEVMVGQQVAEYLGQHASCPDCKRPFPRKGQHEMVYRTVFGKLHLQSPRLYQCSCRRAVWVHRPSFSPLAALLPERTAPELVYLETKFAALLSYGLTVEVLAEVLPIGDSLNTTTARRLVQHTANKAESELGDERWAFIQGCQRDWDQLPPPERPLTVGLDGCYVHATDQPSRTEGWFEVIVGKSMPAEGDARCLAFVQTLDEKPKRRLFELLKSQGMQMNQRIIFVTDGGDDVRELPTFLNPEAEHILDWFHITMRLTVMGQMAKSLATQPPADREDEQAEVDRAGVEKNLERLKWYLWHGNAYQALQTVQHLEEDLDMGEGATKAAAKLLAAVREFGGYIEANSSCIPNYGDRYRHGETISTSFVESAVNQIVSTRMVKRRQMRWSKRGAHLLLQVRTRVLNGDLRNTFSRWYPTMEPSGQEQLPAA